MATVETKLLTAEEFWEWAGGPENEDRLFELDRGRIVERPYPISVIQGETNARIVYLLGSHVRERGAGFVSSRAGLLVGRNPDIVRFPDVMVFGETLRLEQLSDGFSERVPLLLVEVLSRNESLTANSFRISQYLRRGIRLVWLIDPEEPCVIVYQPGREHYIVEATDELTGEQVLPGFRCSLDQVFFSLSPEAQALSDEIRKLAREMQKGKGEQT